CSFCTGRRRALSPTPECLDHYKEVIVLLQSGAGLEARARAALICCEHVRIQALKLVDRSRPLMPSADGSSGAVGPSLSSLFLAASATAPPAGRGDTAHG